MIPAEISVSTGAKGPGLYRRYGKRTFDVLVSLVVLVLFFPVFLVVALLVKLTSPGPVLFLQQRVGIGGSVFQIAKFRSMQSDAAQQGPAITSGGDVRVTPFGRLLRFLKLDELPQFWNVLKGEMSLVGPRPEVPSYVRHYDARQREVLTLRPGITDLASIQYRREEHLLSQCDDVERYYKDVILPHKLELNLDYLKRESFSYDLSLLSRTLASICFSSRNLKVACPKQPLE